METRQPAAAPSEISQLLALVLGKEPTRWYTPHTGLSRAKRFVVHFADGSSAFVKAAVDRSTEQELRTEHDILRSISGDFLPRPVAWIVTGVRPILVLEDLSAAHWPADHWPVAWRPGQFELLFHTLYRIAQVAPPATLPDAQAGFEPRWPAIAANPERFLALGLCSEAWFRNAIGALIAAEAAVPLAGDALVHNDVRSDNLCFVGDRVVLVDWASARRGNAQHDLTTVLTTLPLEGGPDPYTILPNAGSWAAYHAGRSAWRASAHVIGSRGQADPDWLHTIVQRISTICLTWAAQSLNLAPHDGRDWREIR